MKTHRVILGLLIIGLTLGLTFVGCEGEKGEKGPSGINPQMAPIITGVVAAPDSVGTGQNTTLFVSAYDPNGDAMTYHWAVAAGALASPGAAATVWTTPEELGIYMATIIVSDDDGADTATVYVGVNVYMPTVFPSFFGDNPNRCNHCHGDLVEQWMTSGHSQAFDALVNDPDGDMSNNPFCVQCHSTGYDDEVDFAGNVTTPGVNNGGYDDDPRAALRNVQCESCHGPIGPTFNNHAPQKWTAQTGEACSRCHEQYAEWQTAGHGTVLNDMTRGEFFTEWRSASCRTCHISEGFLIANDPDWAGVTLTAENVNPVTCATCHDQHGSDNPYQLRVLADVTSPYGGEEFPSGYTITGLGNGMACAQCHHARRSQSSIMGQIDIGSEHPGPHESPQTDMVMGRASYEIPGYTYDREAQHSTTMLPGMCVECHMYTIPRGEPGGPVNGHSFAADIRKCQTCHPGATTFDIAGVQTEIAELLDSLGTLLPPDGPEVAETMDTLTWTRSQREAGYAYYFVNNDGTKGVHNYEYAHSLLINAITYLNTPSSPMVAGRSKKIEG